MLGNGISGNGGADSGIREDTHRAGQPAPRVSPHEPAAAPADSKPPGQALTAAAPSAPLAIADREITVERALAPTETKRMAWRSRLRFDNPDAVWLRRIFITALVALAVAVPGAGLTLWRLAHSPAWQVLERSAVAPGDAAVKPPDLMAGTVTVPVARTAGALTKPIVPAPAANPVGIAAPAAPAPQTAINTATEPAASDRTTDGRNLTSQRRERTNHAATAPALAASQPPPMSRTATKPDPMRPTNSLPVVVKSAATPETAPNPPGPTSGEIAVMVSRGDALLARGDVTAARLFYRQGADGGDGTAALRLGETYDPAFLARAGLSGVGGSAKDAQSWYRRARDLGDRDAALLLTASGPARPQ
jgi:hypothetical protein